MQKNIACVIIGGKGGDFVSPRSDGVLVMYAPIKGYDMAESLFPIERQREIDACKSEKVKREKYLVWKLLALAVKKRFNLDFANLEFTKTENGKWVCPDFCFSLSHADGVVCVAVSDSPVGVDIERVGRVDPSFLDRFLTDTEREHSRTLPPLAAERFFFEAWVKKESLFKRSGGKALLPRSLDTLTADSTALSVVLNGDEYLIGLALSNDTKYEIIYTEEI